MMYTFTRNGAPQIDARNNVFYMAAGNSPSMMEKNIGQGSQYLWTYRDADGNFLDGARSYTLHILPNIPAGNFWSVVVYDALSRSELQNGQPFPSVSSYTKPVTNADDSIDIAFGPDEPKQKGNWIKTVPGKGWFDVDALGIDQGPILAMIENQRSGLVWKTMRKNPAIVRGLVRAGFTGG